LLCIPAPIGRLVVILMKIDRFLILWLCLAAWPVLAQSPADGGHSFAQWAEKLREERLAFLEPKVVLRSEGKSRGSATRVLMLGDSLSVGAFGESVGAYLATRFGKNNVEVFAAGGSSPQSWLQSEPDYITKCGYRQQTGDGTLLIDFLNGRRPRPVRIPKIETLIQRYRPNAIVIQLGTNWMDGLASKSDGDEYEHDRAVLDRFIAVLRSHPGEDRQIVWILPPDSSKFSNRVQRSVESLIREAAKKNSFEVIASRAMTHYVMGKSGGDGVHYNSEASEAWASLVERDMERKLR